MFALVGQKPTTPLKENVLKVQNVHYDIFLHHTKYKSAAINAKQLIGKGIIWGVKADHTFCCFLNSKNLCHHNILDLSKIPRYGYFKKKSI